MPDRIPGASSDGLGPVHAGDIVTMALAATPVSIGVARAQVGTLCQRHNLEELRETATLLVSELVTNAIMHGTGDITLSIAFGTDEVTVSVTDESPAPPVADPDPPADRPGGRGLFLVDTLASSWNYAIHPGGKTVWFSLSTAPERASAGQ